MQKLSMIKDVMSYRELAEQAYHDIRSPLSALELATRLFPSADREGNDLIHRSLQRINEIVTDLALRANEATGGSSGPALKLELVKPARHPLKELVDVVVAEKRIQLLEKKNVHLMYSCEAAAVNAHGNVIAAEFKRVLSNLIENAIEAVGEDGLVEIRLSVRDQELRVEILDNGVGIPEEVLTKLTHRGFSYGKANGSGLGLYHARAAVASWGGSLKIESEPTKGTRVAFVLPGLDEPQEKIDAVFIDDDAVACMLWQRAAKQANKKLICFTKPADFFAAAERIPKTATVYVDVDLGIRRSGIEVSRQIADLGFQEIYLTTGYLESAFGPDWRVRMPWVRAIKEKVPPWFH